MDWPASRRRAAARPGTRHQPSPDLPAAVEVAGYRIVTEALTNVTRHSIVRRQASPPARRGPHSPAQVADDGVNPGGGWQPGVGLTSIRERTAEWAASARSIRPYGWSDHRPAADPRPVATPAHRTMTAADVTAHEVGG